MSKPSRDFSGVLGSGTSSSILGDVARHAGMPKHQLIERLFD
jgi:hypothetical protein